MHGQAHTGWIAGSMDYVASCSYVLIANFNEGIIGGQYHLSLLRYGARYGVGRLGYCAPASNPASGRGDTFDSVRFTGCE